MERRRHIVRASIIEMRYIVEMLRRGRGAARAVKSCSESRCSVVNETAGLRREISKREQKSASASLNRLRRLPEASSSLDNWRVNDVYAACRKMGIITAS